MGRMRRLREAVVILVTVALVGIAAHGLAMTAALLSGGLDGWASLVSVVVAGIATFVALLSSTLAVLVVRRRRWRVALAALTVLGLAWVAVIAVSRAPSEDVLAAIAYFVAFSLAVWLPVGARWWLDGQSAEEAQAAAPVSRRAGIVAASTCAGVVVVVSAITLAVAGGSVPSTLVGFALILLVTAALTSGRVPETMALALLAGVALSSVLFGLPELPDGGLVTGALALVVLVTFAWRPFAVRLTAARSAVAAPPIPPG